MARLNDTQLIFLSVAAARADSAATFPADMPNAAARQVGAKLVRSGLMGEVEAQPGMPVWREEGDLRLSLVITDAGREAIGVLADPDPIEELAREGSYVGAGEAASAQHAARSEAGSPRSAPALVSRGPEKAKRGRAAANPKPNAGSGKHRGMVHSRSGSKQTLLIKLLSRKSGAGMSEMMNATGWLPHSTRAALTGLRKKGLQVERVQKADGTSIYRLVMTATTAA